MWLWIVFVNTASTLYILIWLKVIWFTNPCECYSTYYWAMERNSQSNGDWLPALYFYWYIIPACHWNLDIFCTIPVVCSLGIEYRSQHLLWFYFVSSNQIIQVFACKGYWIWVFAVWHMWQKRFWQVDVQLEWIGLCRWDSVQSYNLPAELQIECIGFVMYWLNVKGLCSVNEVIAGTSVSFLGWGWSY